MNKNPSVVASFWLIPSADTTLDNSLAAGGTFLRLSAEDIQKKTKETYANGGQARNSSKRLSTKKLDNKPGILLL